MVPLLLGVVVALRYGGRGGMVVIVVRRKSSVGTDGLVVSQLDHPTNREHGARRQRGWTPEPEIAGMTQSQCFAESPNGTRSSENLQDQLCGKYLHHVHPMTKALPMARFRHSVCSNEVLLAQLMQLAGGPLGTGSELAFIFLSPPATYASFELLRLESLDFVPFFTPRLSLHSLFHRFRLLFGCSPFSGLVQTASSAQSLVIFQSVNVCPL